MDRLNAILKEVFGIEAGTIEKNFNLRDLETWDSMAYMMLVSRVEQDFQIELDAEEIVKLLSIDQIELILKERNIV